MTDEAAAAADNTASPADPEATGGNPAPQSAHGHRHRLSISTLVRRGLAIAVVVLILEYFAIPALVGAGKNLSLLRHINPAWVAASLALEATSVYTYALLLRTLLPGRRPSRFTLVRTTLSTTALSHVIPVGTAGGTALGYELLTARGVAGADAALAIAGGALGSAVVLNLLLLIALAISIPLAGLQPVYIAVVGVGLLALVAALALLHFFTRGEEYAVRVVRAVGRHLRRVGTERLERAVRRVGDSLARITHDRRIAARAAGWAAANWLLDAAALWAFVAAFGHYVNPAELFAAYGIANVLAAIPLTPAGLGVIEVSAAALLVGFGLPRTVATLAVVGWRLVNFWLPIPVGAGAYLSLQLPGRAGGRPAADEPGAPAQSNASTDRCST